MHMCIYTWFCTCQRGCLILCALMHTWGSLQPRTRFRHGCPKRVVVSRQLRFWHGLSTPSATWNSCLDVDVYIIDRIAVVWMCPHGVWHAQALGGYGRVWEGMGGYGMCGMCHWEKMGEVCARCDGVWACACSYWAGRGDRLRRKLRRCLMCYHHCQILKGKLIG